MLGDGSLGFVGGGEDFCFYRIAITDARLPRSLLELEIESEAGVGSTILYVIFKGKYSLRFLCQKTG